MPTIATHQFIAIYGMRFSWLWLPPMLPTEIVPDLIGAALGAPVE
ncbi:hypothetical protein [Breoghania sp. L-A4]|nr:hypothetical protein [Breoghania sp. L-A4]